MTNIQEIFEKSKNKALRGGVMVRAFMVVQVSSLMWLRTMMNYQYANGGSISNTFKTLYKEGGITRFYRGYSFANFPRSIIQIW